MIFNVNDLFVEIEGELFPAANIQVYDHYPALYIHEQHHYAYGLYFEMIFENQTAVAVHQEATDIISRELDTICSVDDLDHFLVTITSGINQHREVLHAYHVVGEKLLRETLRAERELNNRPAEVPALNI